MRIVKWRCGAERGAALTIDQQPGKGWVRRWQVLRDYHDAIGFHSHFFAPAGTPSVIGCCRLLPNDLRLSGRRVMR